MGALMGGNARVGLDDSNYLSKGVKATSCAEQVRKIRRILEEFSLEVATPDDVRAPLWAGVTRADGLDHPQLGGDDVDPFRAVLADLHHLAAAARTDQAVGLNPFLDPRQILWQRAPDGGLLLRRPPAALAGCRLLFGLPVGRVLFPCFSFTAATACSRSSKHS